MGHQHTYVYCRTIHSSQKEETSYLGNIKLVHVHSAISRNIANESNGVTPEMGLHAEHCIKRSHSFVLSKILTLQKFIVIRGCGENDEGMN